MVKPADKHEEEVSIDVDVSVLADHYQKTFEIAFEYWKERNRLFVFLVLTSGLGLLILLRVPTADALLVAAIMKFLNITDPSAINNLQTTFPFNILLSVILVVMFYQMQRLYSTNLSVMRNFMYLGAMEKEIRDHLNLPADSVSFTREGMFYWNKRLAMQIASKWSYIVVLFIILVPYVAIKLREDWLSANWFIFVVDVAVSLMILLYWVEYAYSAVKLDKSKPDLAKTAEPSSKPKPRFVRKVK